MVDLLQEKLLRLKNAPPAIPGRPSCRTVWRWAEKGVCGIRLETIKIGHSRYTSLEAIERFCMAVTHASDRT